MTDGEDWAALAAEVRKRRVDRRLPLDLTDQGGPSEMTVRKIEAGEPTVLRPQTKTRLEWALAWRDGIVDRILDGTATDEELKTQVIRPTGIPSAEAIGTAAVHFREVTDSAGVTDNTAAGISSGISSAIGESPPAGLAPPPPMIRRYPGAGGHALGGGVTPSGELSMTVTRRPRTDADLGQRWAEWGPIPLGSAISSVGTAIGLLVNVEDQSPAVVDARKLLQDAFNLLLDEDLRQRDERQQDAAAVEAARRLDAGSTE